MEPEGEKLAGFVSAAFVRRRSRQKHNDRNLKNLLGRRQRPSSSESSATRPFVFGIRLDVVAVTETISCLKNPLAGLRNQVLASNETWPRTSLY
jgi:hypothetical protein